MRNCQTTAALCVGVLVVLKNKNKQKLTDVQVPLGIQISLIGQTALHDVETVVLTGFNCRHALAEGAVEHLGQSSDTRRSAAHLQAVGAKEKKKQKRRLKILSVFK